MAETNELLAAAVTFKANIADFRKQVEKIKKIALNAFKRPIKVAFDTRQAVRDLEKSLARRAKTKRAGDLPADVQDRTKLLAKRFATVADAVLKNSQRFSAEAIRLANAVKGSIADPLKLAKGKFRSEISSQVTELRQVVRQLSQAQKFVSKGSVVASAKALAREQERLSKIRAAQSFVPLAAVEKNARSVAREQQRINTQIQAAQERQFRYWRRAYDGQLALNRAKERQVALEARSAAAQQVAARRQSLRNSVVADRKSIAKSRTEDSRLVREANRAATAATAAVQTYGRISQQVRSQEAARISRNTRLLSQQIQKYGLLGAAIRRAANSMTGLTGLGGGGGGGGGGGPAAGFGGGGGIGGFFSALLQIPGTVISGLVKSIPILGNVIIGIGQAAFQAAGLIGNVFVSSLKTLSGIAIGTGKAITKFLFFPILNVLDTIRLLSRVVVPGLLFGGLIYQLKVGADEALKFENGMTKVLSAGRSAAVTLSRLFGDFAGAFEPEKTVEALVRQVAVDTIFSVNEALDTVNALVSSGIEEPLRALRPTVELAIATGINPDEAARLSSAAISQFGVVGNLENLREVNSALTSATKQSTLTINDLGEALKAGGGAAALAGLNFEEFIAATTGIGKVIPSGEQAGTAIGRDLVLALVPETKEAERRLKTLLSRSGKSIQDFTTKSGAAFRTGGFGDLIAALELGGATLPDFNLLFGAKGRQLASLLGDPKDATDGALRLKKIYESIKIDQKNGLAQQIAEDLQTNLPGKVQQIGERLGLIRLNLFNAIKPQILEAVNSLNAFLQRLVIVTQTSGVFKDILNGTINTMRSLAASLGPVIGHYLRLSAVLTTGVVLALVRLAELVSGRVLQAFQFLTATVFRFTGLPANMIASWSNLFTTISFMLNNFRVLWDIAAVHIKIAMLDIQQFLANSFTTVVASIQHTLSGKFSQMFELLAPVFKSGAELLGGILETTIDHVLENIHVKANRAIDDVVRNPFVRSSERKRIDKVRADEDVIRSARQRNETSAVTGKLGEALTTALGKIGAAVKLPTVRDNPQAIALRNILQQELRRLAALLKPGSKDAGLPFEEIARAFEAAVAGVGPQFPPGPPAPEFAPEPEASKKEASILSSEDFFRSILKPPEMEVQREILEVGKQQLEATRENTKILEKRLPTHQGLVVLEGLI